MPHFNPFLLTGLRASQAHQVCLSHSRTVPVGLLRWPAPVDTSASLRALQATHRLRAARLPAPPCGHCVGTDRCATSRSAWSAMSAVRSRPRFSRSATTSSRCARTHKHAPTDVRASKRLALARACCRRAAAAFAAVRPAGRFSRSLRPPSLGEAYPTVTACPRCQ